MMAESVLASVALESVRWQVEDLSEMGGHHKYAVRFFTRQRADPLRIKVRHELHCAKRIRGKTEGKRTMAQRRDG